MNSIARHPTKETPSNVTCQDKTELVAEMPTRQLAKNAIPVAKIRGCRDKSLTSCGRCPVLPCFSWQLLVCHLSDLLSFEI